MADATATSLANEAEKAAQEALKRQKAEEEALMKAYQASSQGIYDTSKGAAAGALTGSRSDIESLYNTGYQDLQNLIGQESEAAIKESLRPIEGKLGQQGLLGGPSGALNEALAGASERVRNAGLSKLEDYLSGKTSALSNLYSTQGTQLAGLEQAYGTQSQGLQASALENALGLSGKATDITNEYGMAGLEAALGTNKLTLEQAGQKDLLTEQAALNAEAVAAANATKAQELKTAQKAWDTKFYSLKSQLWSSYKAAGWTSDVAEDLANKEALASAGTRP